MTVIARHSRRSFVQSAACVSASALLSGTRRALAAETLPVRLTLGSGGTVDLPADFMGLGYEMSSVAQDGLLSAANRRYVQLVKQLGKPGVARVGGIVANYTRFEPQGKALATPKDTVITQASLDRFDGFLRETGWSAMWSVNFAQGSIADAISEIAAVQKTLGPRLLAVELGNEVDSYSKGQPFRSPSYDFAAYRKEYGEWHAQIVRSLPGIRFAAPDTARNYQWAEAMGRDARGEVQLLAAHYYRNGQTRGNAEQLQKPDPYLLEMLTRLRTVSAETGIPWRMCETSSFSGGGRPGVSDTLLGALWTLDYMLLLAKFGCAGVNMETGYNQLGFVSSYSPILDDGAGGNTPGAPYYGMLAFRSASAGCARIFPLDVEVKDDSVTAYALGSGSQVKRVVIVNRTADHPASVSLAALRLKPGIMHRLTGRAGDSREGVIFAGASVSPDGAWSPAGRETLRGSSVEVPAMSAVVVQAA